MGLMQEIRAFPVARGSVALWWLGQNGFIFKSPAGTLLGIDLYLSNYVASQAPPGMNLNRRVPVLIEPEELDIDFFAATHNHLDHTDPETIARLRNKDTSHFIGPHPSCEVYKSKGIESGRILPMWADNEIEIGDITLRGTFALPTDDTDFNHLGYIVTFGKGPRIYMTGDTDNSPLLHSARKYQPHLLITCMNGGFNNLSHDEAAQLAAAIRPRAAVPCHYDMFPDNSADPHQFESALKLRAPDVEYLQPEHGRVVVFEP
jgi:L-ascorbate 6-phosphate lactonase